MRKLYYDFLIDERPVLTPDAGLSFDTRDLETEDSGVDESGVLHRFLLREKVRTFRLAYDTLTREEYQYLQALVAGKDTFQVRYRDIQGEPAEVTAYCSGHEVSLQDGRLGLLKGLQLEIQEC